MACRFFLPALLSFLDLPGLFGWILEQAQSTLARGVAKHEHEMRQPHRAGRG